MQAAWWRMGFNQRLSVCDSGRKIKPAIFLFAQYVIVL